MIAEFFIGNGIQLAIWILILLLWVFGGLFVWKLSGREAKPYTVFTKTWRTFFSWITPPWSRAWKVFLVVLFIALGLFLIASAPRTEIVKIETGKWYTLEETGVVKSIPDYYCAPVQTPVGVSTQCGYVYHEVTVYRYNIHGYPIYSHVPLWWLDPGLLLLGLTFIIIGLIIAAASFVREVNKAYGVS